MSSKFSIVLALLGVLGIAACTVREVPYEDEIAAWRTDKDRFMRESSESPVVASERSAFPPLTYFPINQEYRVPASLNVSRVDDILEMSTSTGQKRGCSASARSSSRSRGNRSS